MRTRILFIPSLFYLSNKLLIRISNHLGDLETMFLDAEYALNKKHSSDYDKEINTLKRHFNQVDRINDTHEYGLSNEKDPILRLKFYRNKRRINSSTVQKIKQLQPDLIVMTSDRTDTFKLVVNYFKDIPVLVIQQGTLQEAVAQKLGLKVRLRYLFLKVLFKYPTLSINPWVRKAGITKKIFKAYWSSFWVYDHITENVFFTGNPSLDEVIFYGNNRLENMENYNFTAPRVLYTTQPLASVFDFQKQNQFNEHILNFINNKPDLNLTIKVHPREDLDYYSEFFGNSTCKNIRITKEADLDTLFDKADLLITGYSGTSYQAVARGVPVIALDTGDLYDYGKFFPGDGVIVVKSFEEMTKAFDKLTSLEGFKDFINKRSSFLKIINTFDDNQSGKRLAELIRHLAG
ncbi:MAG TPA: CDP-glycerol glycerophosphotransferase family protein [Desulfobacteraceae bacterium]|nr:CDP-glycerol glycerophosphotransferase family protein [Desulfobacteraceae bacterium]